MNTAAAESKPEPTRDEIETAKLAILMILENRSRNMHTVKQTTSNLRSFACAPVVNLYPPDSTKTVKNYLNPFKSTPDAGDAAMAELRDAAPPLIKEEPSGKGHVYSITAEGKTHIQTYMRDNGIALEETTLATRSHAGYKQQGNTRA